jgi:hypothetical protein
MTTNQQDNSILQEHLKACRYFSAYALNNFFDILLTFFWQIGGKLADVLQQMSACMVLCQ